jgi:putative nucleotidyltransferase with HDIG domain
MNQAHLRQNRDLAHLPPLPESLERVRRASAGGPSAVLAITAALEASPAFADRWKALAGELLEAGTTGDFVLRLGAGTAGQLALVAALGEVFPLDDELDLWLWEHAMETGRLARDIARSTGAAFADQAFVAGALHDAGKLAMKSIDPEAYAEVASEARITGRWAQPEWDAFDYEHTDMGGWLLESWGASPELVLVAGRHHATELLDPSEIGRARREAADVPPPAARLLAVVSLANELTGRRLDGRRDGRGHGIPIGALPAHMLRAARFLDLSAARLAELQPGGAEAALSA